MSFVMALEWSKVPKGSILLMILVVAFGGAQAFLPTSAWGRGEGIPGSRYTSGRAAGMGDAFLPLADDGASALFYNPAGIAAIKKTRVEPTNYMFKFNDEFRFNRTALNFFSMPDYSEAIAGTGEYPGMGGQFASTFSTTGFAFGIVGTTQYSAEHLVDEFHYRTITQLIPAAGVGINLAKGIVRLGYSAQWVHRVVGDQQVPVGQEYGWYNRMQSGSAISHNVGYALTLPFTFLPSINVVGRNILNATYTSFSVLSPIVSDGEGVPDTEPLSIDISVSQMIKLGKMNYANVIAEVRDFTSNSGFSITRRTAFGAELSFADVLFFRGGWSQLTPSLGLGLRRPKAEFALAWYGEKFISQGTLQAERFYLVHARFAAF